MATATSLGARRLQRAQKKQHTPRHRTGCFACKRKHNTNKVQMVQVKRPDGEGTVQVCKAKVEGYERA